MLKLSSAIKDARNFLSSLTAAKLHNLLCIKISYLSSRIKGKPKICGMPVSLSIEPTTSCNLRCTECPSGLRQFTRPQGRMNVESFRHVIDQLKNKLMYLILYFQGEPLLNPDFMHMVKYARAKGIYTSTSTNAHLLDQENAAALVASGLDRLIISLDGTDQQTYEKYRKGGHIEKAKQGIVNIMETKRQLNRSRPYVIIQFIVFRFNEHQLNDIRKLSKELGVDRLEIKTAQVYDFENDVEMIPNNPKYARYVKDEQGTWRIKKKIRNHCYRMWSGAVITWDGRVVPCCFDKDATHQMGKLGEQSFREIWKGKSYQQFRCQISEKRSQINICRNCTE